MTLTRWIIPIVVGLALWFLVIPMAKVSNVMFAVMLTIGLLGLIGLVFRQVRLPIPFLSSPLGLIIFLAVPIIFGGAFGLLQGFKWGASVSPPYGNVPSVSDCYGSVDPEIRGSAATITLNAYDLESDSSTNVDLTTNCWFYKNSVNSANYLGQSADTTSGSVTGVWSVGDVAMIRCGGTGYYTDPKDVCINTANKAINLDSHAMVATSNLQITGYDSTGASTLTAGATNINDYNITMGAGETQTFYLKLKNNVANKAFQFQGWAIATFYNISSCKPVTGYTAEAIPAFLHNVNVYMNSGTSVSITKDYTPWVRSSPLLLREWEEVKDQFEIKSDPTNNPNGNANTTSFNGVAIVAFDSTYSVDASNVASFGYYTPDSAQSNVGLAETLTSPLGKDNGVLICVE